MHLTQEHFLDLLHNIVSVKQGNDNAYFGVYPPDKNCHYKIVINFFYEKERIIFLAHAPDMRIQPYDIGKAIMFCNKMNALRLNQVSYYYAEESEIRMSGCLFTDCPLSDDYILRNFILFYTQSAINFFREAAKKFPIENKV